MPAIPHEQYCQLRIAECEKKGKPEFAKAWAAHLEKYVEERSEREDEHASFETRQHKGA